MKKLIILCRALLIGLLVSGCSGKKAPSYVDDENKSALKANRISEYRVTGADEKGVEVTEVFGVRLGEVFSESKHGGKLAVVIPDVSANQNPDPTIWKWRKTDPETQSVTFQPPRPNPLFSEYILHYDKKSHELKTSNEISKLIQLVRNESHRFAIKHHRKRRSKVKK